MSLSEAIQKVFDFLSKPETGHGRFGISLLQIRIVSYHWWQIWFLKKEKSPKFSFLRWIWFFFCWETLFFITLLCSVIKSGWCPQRASFQFLPAFRIIGTLKPSNWFSVTWRTIASPRLQLFRQMAARQLGRRWRRFGLIVTSACAGSTPRKTANVNWVSFHNVSLLLHFY